MYLILERKIFIVIVSLLRDIRKHIDHPTHHNQRLGLSSPGSERQLWCLKGLNVFFSETETTMGQVKLLVVWAVSVYVI